MDTKLAARQIRIQQWAAIIKDCRESGLKVDDYCQQHEITHDAYYYWLRKVKEAALVQSGFVELPMSGPATNKESSFLTVNINGITLEMLEMQIIK